VIILKNNIKIYIKIAPTYSYFCAVALSAGNSLSVLARIMSSLKIV